MRTKRIVFVIVLLTMMVTAGEVCRAQDKRKPSTPEERARAVRIAHALEADPLNKDYRKDREWLLYWLIQSPDISLTICTDYLSPLYQKGKDREKNYAAEIATQMTYSSAAFFIEHPDQAEDEIAVSVGGLEGSLKAYEAIVKAKPDVKWPFLDELIVKRDKGTLLEHVREIGTTKCKGSKK